MDGEKRPEVIQEHSSTIIETSQSGVSRPPSNITSETTSTSEYQLPPLPYGLSPTRRRRAIAIFFILIFIETCFIPLVLYYSFRLGAHLSMQTNLAIITSLVGTFSGFKLAIRTWVLWYREGEGSHRPIGGGKWGLDTFHIWISTALTAFFVPLIIGSSLTPARPDIVALALPCFMLAFCIPLAITGLFPGRIRVPFRVSSMPAGEPLPPLTYTITEDVVGVDGGGMLAFRYALCRRYKASRTMRRIMRITALAWGISGCAIGGGVIAAALTAPTDIAYALGYGVPWVWAGFLAVWTVFYVRRRLVDERSEWDRGVRVEMALPVCASPIDKEADTSSTRACITRGSDVKISEGGK